MKMKRRRLVAALAGVVLAGSAAAADTFPQHPIRIIVPYAAGGTTDIVARIISEPLGQALGQPVLIDNKAGAGGAVGTAEIARSAPDGYTLGIGTVSTMVIIPASTPKLNYKVADFAPITNIAATPNIIAVNPSFPAKNGREFIAILKANPNKYSFASSGKGSINHMMGESFQAMSGTELTHIPYRGAGPAINDVIAGQVPIIVDQLPSSKGFIDSGKLRLMGVIAPKRLSAYPDVPTFEELGLKGFADQAWYGLIAPGKTPPAVLAKLGEAMQKVLARPDVRSRLEKAGANPVGNTPAQYAAQMKSEGEAMKRLITVRKITLDE